MAKLKEVRLGVIGCGSMANHHMGYFKNVARLKFTAACDIDPQRVGDAVAKYGVEGFSDGNKLIRSGLVDAVLIATPHYFHPTFAIEAMSSGLHVLSEKPVAVTAKDAARMNAAHKKYPNTVFAVMFQMRTVPKYKKAKQLLDAGEIGPIQRVTWIITPWFRPQAYYDSGTWRATWAGEGGGVLLNQCPHNLDILTWLTGTPNLVHAYVKLGKYHHIEVEDEVNAYFEYASGATGNFITSTGEAPGIDRLELAGDLGRMVLVEGSNKIEIFKNRVATSVFNKTSQEMFARPETDKITIEVTGQAGDHQEVTTRFIGAIIDGTPLIARGEEGLSGLELGNAMMMSGLTGKPVKIPTPRDQYDKLIKDMAAKSTFKKAAVKKTKADMSASFHK